MSKPAPGSSEFLWGVATSAYQTEGGYNDVGQPQTNWAEAERRNDVVPLGNAAEFWSRFAEDFARCRELGLNAFRLGIEWSRVQPIFTDNPGAPPPFDYVALDHYSEMLAECRRCGLEPIITLHHFVHPSWLGPDPWLSAEIAPRFAAFVAEAVRYLNARLIDVYGVAPIRFYITINEPNMLVLNTYVGHLFPSRAEPGVSSLRQAYAQLFRAHVLAYNVIHDLHRDHGWAAPSVALNNYCSDIYWTDKLWLDLLSLRASGVAREDVLEHVSAKAGQFQSALKRFRLPRLRRLSHHFGGIMKRISDRYCASFISADSVAPLLDAIYESPRTQLLDYIGLDYYDPFAANVFRLPVWWDHEFKNKSLRSWLINSITSKWWDWRVLPKGLRFFCEYYHAEFQLPLLIAENGMALRRRGDEPHSHRRDRVTRSQFLRLHLHEVDKILQQGIPLIGYLHWSLFDNYEWGTYTPRFGLFSIDYERGTERIAVDHFGDRPSETYARLIAESRAAESARAEAAA